MEEVEQEVEKEEDNYEVANKNEEVEEDPTEDVWWGFLRMEFTDVEDSVDVAAVTQAQAKKSATKAVEEESSANADEPLKAVHTEEDAIQPVDEQPVPAPLFTKRKSAQAKKKEEDSTPHIPHDPRHPAYRLESKVNDPSAIHRVYNQILDAPITLPVRDLYAISKDLVKEAVNHKHTNCIPNDAAVAVNILSPTHSCPTPPLNFTTPLRVIDIVVASKQHELALLDKGSEIVVIHKDLAKECGLDVNKHRQLIMETASGAKDKLPECAEQVQLDSDGLITIAHAFIILRAPYCILLGCPWQRTVRLEKWETASGVTIRIWEQDSNNPDSHVIDTQERKRPSPSFGISTVDNVVDQ